MKEHLETYGISDEKIIVLGADGTNVNTGWEVIFLRKQVIVKFIVLNAEP